MSTSYSIGGLGRSLRTGRRTRLGNEGAGAGSYAPAWAAAGDEIPVPGRGDRAYPFRAHSEYFYLADR